MASTAEDAITLTLQIQNLGEYLRYLPAYKVIICKDHGAVRSWKGHLADSHNISAKQQKALNQQHQISTLPLDQLANIALPPPNHPPIPLLGPPLAAFTCSYANCDYITICRKNIRRHYNKHHNWTSSKDNRQPWLNIQAQTFFSTGGLQRYFQVQPLPKNEGNLPATTSNVSRIIQEIQSSQAQHAESLVIADATVAKTDHTGWFNRNRWPIHLACCNLAYLSKISRMPDKDDTLLGGAAEVVELTIEQAVAGLSTLGLESRRWLRSANAEQPDVRPMARLQNPESQKRYAGYMKRFICYLLRVLDAQAGSMDSESDTLLSQAEEESEPNSDTESPTGRSNHGENSVRKAKWLFPWSGDQKQLAQDFVNALHLDSQREQINCLLRLFQAFIFQTTGDKPFKSGLIHFLAVLGIDETTNRLREAHDFSYMLAGVVYCTRVLALEILLPAAQREHQGEQERESFTRARKQYLVDGTYSPFSEMLSLLAYSKHIALNAANAPISQWSQDRGTLYMRGQPILLLSFKAMVAGVLQEAEDCLWNELLWTTNEADRFQIPLGKIQDDVTFSQRGYSFLSRPDNELAGSLEETIAKMMASPKGRKLRNPRNSAWQPQPVRRYLRWVDRFLEFLLFLTHVTGGQPARGTEITTARYRNGYMQDRNIFVMDGQVVFISRYHKSQALWDKPKVVPRFLPWRVGQLFTIFLAYVQPLAEHLRSERLGISRTDYIWSGATGPWETNRLSQIIARETSIRLGCRLTTLEYRHTAITIGREVVSKQFSEGTQEAITEGEWEEPEMELESGLDLQAGRSELTGTLRYGVEMGIVAHLSHRSIQLFQHLSGQWHRFLQLSSTLPTARTPVGIAKRPAVSDPGRGAPPATLPPLAVERVPESAAISDLDLQTLAQRALQQEGPLTFKSPQQETALRAIVAGETPLVVILPTGGGKSLLFMAPACLPDSGVSIVVVPFRELLNNLKKRLAEARIPVTEWVAGRATDTSAAVVLVSADTAGDFQFLTYATVLNQGGWLKRIFVDECHLTYTSNDWRPRLAHLSRLRSITGQFILLTATQPPLLEYELGLVMALRTPRYIRAATSRPNIRYLVQRCQQGALLTEARAVARRWLAQLSDKEKAIIYCKSKAQCERLGEQLNCPSYHAGMESEQRSQALKSWLKSGGLITATSSLGTGVDYPQIVRVLHVGVPYGMIDFAQESGRAGRGGELVDSVILVEEPRQAMPPVLEPVDQQWRTLDTGAMHQFIHAGPGACRRNILSMYLDGQSAKCAQIQAANCDLCGEGAPEWADALKKEAQEEAQIRQALNELVDGCPICWVMGNANWSNHVHAQCPWCAAPEHKPYSLDVCEAVREQKLRWTTTTHTCYKCGLSQQFCATRQGMAEKCQWPGIMIPILVVVLLQGKPLLERLGYQGGDMEETLKWFAQKHGRRKWGAVVNNAMVVLGAVLTQPHARNVLFS